MAGLAGRPVTGGAGGEAGAGGDAAPPGPWAAGPPSGSRPPRVTSFEPPPSQLSGRPIVPTQIPLAPAQATFVPSGEKVGAPISAPLSLTKAHAIGTGSRPSPDTE